MIRKLIKWYTVNIFNWLLEGTLVNETIQVPHCRTVLEYSGQSKICK